MKRKVVAAVLTMAMAGSLLAGCGSSSSDDSSSKSETTTPSVVVHLLRKYLQDTQQRMHRH